MWGMKKMIVIPVIIGALGAVSKEFDKLIEKIGTDLTVGTCAENSIIRNSKNIEEGVRNLKKMDIDFETFSCLIFEACSSYSQLLRHAVRIMIFY